MKILVAGAGHGGLAAAALLAKDGHSVTVFEKNTRGTVELQPRLSQTVRR